MQHGNGMLCVNRSLISLRPGIKYVFHDARMHCLRQGVATNRVRFRSFVAEEVVVWSALINDRSAAGEFGTCWWTHFSRTRWSHCDGGQSSDIDMDRDTHTWERPATCTLFLINLSQLNYPIHVSNKYLFIIRRLFLYMEHTVLYHASIGCLAASRMWLEILYAARTEMTSWWWIIIYSKHVGDSWIGIINEKRYVYCCSFSRTKWDPKTTGI